MSTTDPQVALAAGERHVLPRATSSSRFHVRWHWLRHVLLAALVTALLLAGFAVWGYLAFGSFRGLHCYAKGMAVMPDSSFIQFGEVKAGSTLRVPFVLTNLRSQAVTVIGADSTCSCLRPLNAPLVLSPRANQTLVLELSTSANSAGQAFSMDATLYLDCDSAPVIVTVGGHLSSH
ncbi:MAG: DUF1573 domain-containing protein [Pirellulales bacterium]|nr:DUF1573 domain-containing protein [Pirellulales bacterium]